MRRRAVLSLTVMTAALVAALMASGLASAQATGTTFTVNRTDDLSDTDLTDNTCDTLGLIGSQCSLRAAIEQANATANSGGSDQIAFAIPGSGPHTIRPSSQMPQITESVTIDGYTQSGATENTNVTGGVNAVPLVELIGNSVGGDQGSRNGLFISAPDVVVRGLVISGWSRGIVVVDNKPGAAIEGNFIGTDTSGTLNRGNTLHGVIIAGTDATVGGSLPEARNLISGNGNGQTGGINVEIIGDGATGNKVEGNLIGTQKDGTTAINSPLGEEAQGVFVSGSDNTVGGTASGAGNVIAFNGKDGVSISFNGTGNRILSNSIFSNGDAADDLGIDLNNDGVTLNDRKDRDTGPNTLQNFPKITSATTASGTTTITGKLNSRPRKFFTIQFFSNPSGTDEGKTFIGQTTVKTNRKGSRSFSFTPSAVVPAGEVITATATNDATGDTSEFSKACPVPSASCP